MNLHNKILMSTFQSIGRRYVYYKGIKLLFLLYLLNCKHNIERTIGIYIPYITYMPVYDVVLQNCNRTYKYIRKYFYEYVLEYITRHNVSEMHIIICMPLLQLPTV